MRIEVDISVSVPEILELCIGTTYKIEAPNKTDAEIIARKRFKNQFPSITNGKKLQVYSRIPKTNQEQEKSIYYPKTNQ